MLHAILKKTYQKSKNNYVSSQTLFYACLFSRRANYATPFQEKPKFASVMTNGEGSSPSSDSSAGALSPTEVRKGGNEEGINQIGECLIQKVHPPIVYVFMLWGLGKK